MLGNLMRVFYYQHKGKTYVICVRGSDAGRKSPIWNNCNTSSWMIPCADMPASD